MRDAGKVSVIIPTYNRLEYLLDCVNSIRNQSYQNLDIIIISDGGTDDSEHRINELNDNRISFIRLAKNHGRPAPARNMGLEKAVGDFICFCDDDDTWHPDKLKLQLALVESGSEIVFSGYKVRGATLKPYQSIKYCALNVLINRSIISSFAILSFLNPVCNSSVLVVKSAVGKFRFNESENLRAIEDYICWISIFRGRKVSFSLRPLVDYRIHEDNISANRNSGVKGLLDYVQTHGNNLPKIWKIIFLLSNKIRLRLL